MTLRWSPLLAAAIAGLAFSVPCQAETLSLNAALAIAYDTNPQLGGARAGVRATDENVAEANAGWRPQISASATYGMEHGDIQGSSKSSIFGATPFTTNTHPVTGQVAVTENIFRGGRTFAEVGHAIAQVQSARAQLSDVERGVLMDSVTAYMDVVRDEKIVSANQQNVKFLETQLNDVQTERAAGAVTKTDVAQAEARLALAKADLAAAVRQRDASRASFENVIGQPAPTLDASPPIPRLPAGREQAKELAGDASPRVLQARADLKAADYAVRDAIGALLPQLSVQGQYQYLQDSGGTNIFSTNAGQNVVSVLGQLTVPIYQGGAEDAAVRRAKEERSQAELAVQTAQRTAWQDLAGAWDGLTAAKTQMTANAAQVKADDFAVSGVTQEQQAGERSVLDILNAQQELLNAQVGLASAQHDYIVAAYRVLWATGQLSARALSLRVNYYDPRVHYDDDAGAWYGLGN
jgi:TolC family type I secretion outer membrane protein